MLIGVVVIVLALLMVGLGLLKREIFFGANGWGVHFKRRKMIPWSSILNMEYEKTDIPFFFDIHWAVLTLRTGNILRLPLNFQSHEPHVMWEALSTSYVRHSANSAHKSKRIFG